MIRDAEILEASLALALTGNVAQRSEAVALVASVAPRCHFKSA